MTGACHAPVAGRQGKALADTAPSASPVPAENPQIASGQSERNVYCFSQTMGGECSEGQATSTPCFAEPVQVANMAEASAEAAYPLGERNALLMRSVKSAFALLLTKVTKPAAERRKVFQSNNRKIGGDIYKTNNQRNVR